MKTQQKAPGRTNEAQDVKTISPETWARLRPLAREMLMEIAELLANDAPPTRVEAVFQKGKRGTEYTLGVDGDPFTSVFSLPPAEWEKPGFGEIKL